MDKHVEERFERIERNLETMSERQKELQAAHIELEAAQKNGFVLLNKTNAMLDSFISETKERIEDLTILVNELVKKNMNGH